ncbi:MAG: hypothetical protein ACRD0G_17205 [Acidimicrobiales bacterium]
MTDDDTAPALDRLAELVVELAGCDAAVARDVLLRITGDEVPDDPGERLAIVARALVAIRRLGED